MAKGDELLIVESVDAHRDALSKLFDQAGYVCTAVASIPEAMERVEKKFFPAALVDLDVGKPGGGLDLLRTIRARSKQTGVILLMGRRSFEGAVDAFRLGAVDVILKQSSQSDHLRHAVDGACDRYRSLDTDSALLRDMQTILDESFQVMLTMARGLYQNVSIGSGAPLKPRILLVDSDTEFVQELLSFFQAKGWDFVVEVVGGAALDKASERTFDVVAVREELMDLTGTVVIKSIEASRPNIVGVLYSTADGVGRVEKYVEGRQESVHRSLTGAADLFKRLEETVEKVRAAHRDRQVLQAFRGEHQDYLRRFAAIKKRVSRILH